MVGLVWFLLRFASISCEKGQFKAASTEEEYPPSLACLGVQLDSDLRDVEEDLATALRACQDDYIDFLKNYGKAVYGKLFITKAHSKALSQFLTTCMEAFLVVAYANGYERWKEEALREKNESRSNTIPSYRFTSFAKGAKACEGWSEDGVKLYDDLYDMITQQRSHPTFGTAFEKQFMVRCGPKAKSNGKRKHRNDWSNIEAFGV